MARIRIIARCLPALLLGVVGACKGRASNDTASNTGAISHDTAGASVAPAAAPVVVLTVVEKPGVGSYLADSNGHAVYTMETPSGAPATCTGDCATSYKPVVGSANPAKGDTAVQAALITIIPGPDSTKQVAYNGKPLYYYSGDQGPTDTKGQSRKGKGETTYLVSPQGKKITAKGGQRGTVSQ
jgi:predicted lipoprotein with Yx(FWY)xxD motif